MKFQQVGYLQHRNFVQNVIMLLCEIQQPGIAVFTLVRNALFAFTAKLRTQHAATDDTTACRPGVTGYAGGKISARCLVISTLSTVMGYCNVGR